MGPRGSEAFTLVEVLIVVVLLGVLSAIVVPQFASASDDARLGSVRSQTATIESQLELWAARHAGVYPDLVAEGWGDADTPGTMVGGQYLKSAPRNPFANENPGSVLAADFNDAADADQQADAADPAAGAWLYDRTNGFIRAAGADYLGDG